MREASDRWVLAAHARLMVICAHAGRAPSPADHAAVLRAVPPPPYVLRVLDRAVTAGGSFYRPGARLVDTGTRESLGGYGRSGGSSGPSPFVGAKRRREDFAVRQADVISPADAPSLLVFFRCDTVREVPPPPPSRQR